MGAIGGLDVAYGASAQIIQTNVLLVDNTGETATGVNPDDMANFLSLFNRTMSQNTRGRSILECDYVAAAVGPTGSTGQTAHREVLEATSQQSPKSLWLVPVPATTQEWLVSLLSPSSLAVLWSSRTIL